MPKLRHELRALYLQAREEPEIRTEEHESFAKHSGLATQQIDALNAFDTPSFAPNVIDGYDMFFIGGSSGAKAEKLKFNDSCQELVRYCIAQSIPSFCSCFGFQLAVVAAGGTILRDEENYEMACMPISLTSAAAEDPVLQGTPDNFIVLSVHQEYAKDLPAEFELLGYTEHCSHIFRVKSKPFWGFQFHPELDKAATIQRLLMYQDCYLEGQEQLNALIESLVETPHSNALLANFIERVLLA